MPSLFAKVALFVSSFVPLLAVLVLLDSFRSRIVNLLLVTVAVSSVVLLFLFLKLARSLNPSPMDVSSVARRDGDAMAYLMSYVVPFLGLATSTPRERMALALFLLVVLALYVQADLFYVNPLLALAKYHILEIEVQGKTVILLSKRRHLRSPVTVDVHLLGNGVALEALCDKS